MRENNEFKIANKTQSLNNILNCVGMDSFSSYEDENFIRVLNLLQDDTNIMNARTCVPRAKVKHVSVQTIPEIDDVYIPWLLEAETKTEEFCVELSNLVNTLYHSSNRISPPKSKISSSAIPIMNTHPGKSHRPNANSKSSGCTKIPGGRSENFEEDILFELIKDRVYAALKSAMELKESIPKVSLEKFEEFTKKEFVNVESTTVKETRILKLERSKSTLKKTGRMPPQICKVKRGPMMSTINDSQFKEERYIHEVSKQLSQMSCGTGKPDGIYSVLKRKNLENAKNTAPGTSRQPSKAQANQINPKDADIPTKDTGAIPKVKESLRVTSSNATIRTQKTKKTNVKPLWR